MFSLKQSATPSAHPVDELPTAVSLPCAAIFVLVVVQLSFSLQYPYLMPGTEIPFVQTMFTGLHCHLSFSVLVFHLGLPNLFMWADTVTEALVKCGRHP